MQRILIALSGLTFLFIAVTASAESTENSQVPKSGLYLGLGLSGNSTQYNAQTITGTGLTTDTIGGRTGYGYGTGETGVAFSPTRYLSPTVQVGYFRKLEDSEYLWGTKFTYNYLGWSTSTTTNVQIPQYGTSPTGAPLQGGNAVAASYQQTLQSQFAFVPYFGKSFTKSMAYIGIGPTYTQLKTQTNNLVGYAELAGRTVNVSGTPQSFVATQWVWGGMAMLGGSYFLDESWFLDFNYNFSMTQNAPANRASPFTNTPTTGMLIGSSNGYATTHALSLTLNLLF